MMDRLLLAVGIMLAGALLYQLWLVWQRHRLSGLTTPGRPTLLYFSSPQCAPCRFQQTPAVETLNDELGTAAEFTQVDVTQHPELAARWRVMTVPTTIVLKADGRVQAINPGVASAQHLRQQLVAASDGYLEQWQTG